MTQTQIVNARYLPDIDANQSPSDYLQNIIAYVAAVEMLAACKGNHITLPNESFSQLILTIEHKLRALAALMERETG